MTHALKKHQEVGCGIMHFGGGGGRELLIGCHEEERSCLIGLSISYLFLQGPRWRDGGKNGDKRIKRGQKDDVKGEERDKNAQRDIFVHHVHRQSEQHGFRTASFGHPLCRPMATK